MTGWTISLLSLAHLLFVICNDNFFIVKELFSQYLEETIVILVILFLCILLDSIGFRFRELTYGVGFCALMSLNYLIYKVNNSDDKMVVNPMSTIILCGSVPLSIFVSVFLHKQLNLISRALTCKQLDSIMKDADKANKKGNEAYLKILRKARGRLTCKDKCYNIVSFITKTRPKSLFS